MDWIKTGIGLRRTIKNVVRAREILSVFWRNGFDEFMVKTKIHRFIPGFVVPSKKYELAYQESLDKDVWEVVGMRLRKTFEELGPSFIKLGQLLSSREDILDPKLIAELKLLQSEALDVDFAIMKKQIEESLGKKIEEVFCEFDERPIGRASIGIVYQGTLKSGEKVVVKARRPDIKRTIANDFEIISYLANRLEKVSSEFRYMGISRAIDDFFESIQLELNFVIEARNCQKLKENIGRIDKENDLVLPDVYEEHSSEALLVMSKLEGIPFNQIRAVSTNKVLEQKLLVSVKYFMHTMLVDGFFHADLHGGNFFLLSEDRVGIIDFGLIGTLNKKNRENLVALLYALTTNNFENLVYEFLDVAEYDQVPDHDELIRDIESSLAPYVGMSVQEMDVTAFVNTIVTTLAKHRMYLPRQWFIIFRSLMTLDGVGKSLGIDINMFEIINEQIGTIIKKIVSKEALLEESLWIGRDAVSFLRILPRHIKWLFKDFARKKYRIDLNLLGTNQKLEGLTQSVFYLANCILSGIVFYSGVVIIGEREITALSTIPILTWILWGMATVLFINTLLFNRR